MKLFLCVYLFFIVLLSFVNFGETTPSNNFVFLDETREGRESWWKNTIMYQINVPSFMDSNNDGIGDLRGIIQKMPHLAHMRVNAIILSPIFNSPNVDFGYDVSDYRSINPIYGTLEDFRDLVQAAHYNGIYVILDFVPNHTSTKHEWFQKSIAGEEPYKDYYIWREGKNNNTEPPNNWISHFHGTAWSYNEERKLWYLHQFHSTQPDLNYRNPAVRQEIKDILLYWVQQYIVYGFRMNAVSNLVEAEDFPDEELSNDPNCNPNERCYMNELYQMDQPETYEIVYDWREMLDKNYEENGGDVRCLIAEAYSPLDKLIRYYGSKNGKQLGAHFPMNFALINEISTKSNATRIIDVINRWIEASKGYHSNWVLGTHNYHRLATRFGADRADGMFMLQMVLPGIAVTYNGEEIAMENGEVTWEQGVDPLACGDIEEKFEKNSRDFQRTPMQWDNSTNAGFNKGYKTWLPVSEKYLSCNVKDQVNEYRSPYSLFWSLMLLRRMDVFKLGFLKVEALADNNVLKVQRHTLFHLSNYLLLMNLANTEQTFKLKDTPDFLLVHAANTKSKHHSASLFIGPDFKLEPYETLLVEV